MDEGSDFQEVIRALIGDWIRGHAEPLVNAVGIVDGQLALGCNALVAYMPFFGYTFEDGIVISDSLARCLTSTHIYEYQLWINPTQGEYFTSRARQTEHHHLTKDGLIPEDQPVEQDELLIRKHAANGRYRDEHWKHPFPGRVLRSWIVDGERARVQVEADRPVEIGDKLMGR